MKKSYLILLNVIFLVSFAILLYFGLVFPPVERIMGVVQKIFYVHIGLVAMAMFSFFFAFVLSVIYLLTDKPKIDILASNAVYIGTLMFALVIITGMIWAKPAWGTYWVWDPRLTISLMTFLLYVAYIMLRMFIEDHAKRATFSSVLAIMTFVLTPINFFATRWWNSMHPVILGKEGGSGLAPDMVIAMQVAIVMMAIMYAVMSWEAYALQVANYKKRMKKLDI